MQILSLSNSPLPVGYGEALLPVAQAKAWLNVVTDEWDALIEALRDASIDAVEQYTSLYLAPRTDLVARFTGFDGTPMRLGRGPDATVAVTGVSYVDGDGAPVALTTADWRVLAGGRLAPAVGTCWPTSYGDVTVTFDVGFPDGAAPPGLLQAARFFLAHLFANREAVVMNGATGELPLGFCMLCDQHRMPVI